MNDKKNNSIENVKNSEKFPLFVVVDGPTPSHSQIVASAAVVCCSTASATAAIVWHLCVKIFFSFFSEKKKTIGKCYHLNHLLKYFSK